MNFLNKKILITGGTGFIGSNIAIYLANLGANIVITTKKRRDFYYDNLSNF